MQTTVEQYNNRNPSPKQAVNRAWLRRRAAALPVAARHHAFAQPSLPDVAQAVQNSDPRHLREHEPAAAEMGNCKGQFCA